MSMTTIYLNGLSLEKDMIQQRVSKFTYLFDNRTPLFTSMIEFGNLVEESNLVSKNSEVTKALHTHPRILDLIYIEDWCID